MQRAHMIRLLRQNLTVHLLRLRQSARLVMRDAGFELLLKIHSPGHYKPSGRAPLQFCH
jgi:hypothetical protein